MGMLSSKIIATRYVFRFGFYLPGCRCLCETTGDVQTPAFSRIPKLPEMAVAAWRPTKVMIDRENCIAVQETRHKNMKQVMV